MSILVTLFDRKASQYLPPVSFHDVTNALRTYQQVLTREVTPASPPWVQYPEDFEMYQLGEFTERSGMLVAYDQPQFLEHLSTLTKKGSSNAKA